MLYAPSGMHQPQKPIVHSKTIRISIILHSKKTSNEGFNQIHSYSPGDKKFPAEVSGTGCFLVCPSSNKYQKCLLFIEFCCFLCFFLWYQMRKFSNALLEICTEISINISYMNVISRNTSLIYFLVDIFAMKWLNLTLSSLQRYSATDTLVTICHPVQDNLQRWWVVADIFAMRK